MRILTRPPARARRTVARPSCRATAGGASTGPPTWKTEDVDERWAAVDVLYLVLRVDRLVGRIVPSPAHHRLARIVTSRSSRIRRVTEHADDVPGQMVLDLAVSWDRLGHPGGRVPVPVVPPAMADQDASESLDRADQVGPLHGTTNSSTLRIPGSSPLVRSR